MGAFLTVTLFMDTLGRSLLRWEETQRQLVF